MTLRSNYGPSGDIGFTQKSSNTNGLRAVGQQYLHSKLNTKFPFEGVPAMGRPFFMFSFGIL